MRSQVVCVVLAAVVAGPGGFLYAASSVETPSSPECYKCVPEKETVVPRKEICRLDCSWPGALWWTWGRANHCTWIPRPSPSLASPAPTSSVGHSRLHAGHSAVEALPIPLFLGESQAAVAAG